MPGPLEAQVETEVLTKELLGWCRGWFEVARLTSQSKDPQQQGVLIKLWALIGAEQYTICSCLT